MVRVIQDIMGSDQGDPLSIVLYLLCNANMVGPHMGRDELGWAMSMTRHGVVAKDLIGLTR